MIRINLLAVERKAGKRAGFTFHAGQGLTIGCSAILVVAALFVGWRFWALQQQSARIDMEIADAQQQGLRLRAIILQVQQFELQKAQLQQRVVLIEQLRKSQSGPVHMLDQISRALPPMLWLTELKQTPTGEVMVDGRSTTLTGLSDFVANLEASGYFKRSVEIVSTTAEPSTTTSAELIKFSIKAIFQPPGEKPAPVAPARPGA
jgi:type IV pilus assembly protein PilN